MDRIKSQREEWVNTRSLGEVGESPAYLTLNQAGDNQSPGEWCSTLISLNLLILADCIVSLSLIEPPSSLFSW
ncbi:hypothetical protein DPMN_156883 [Dreissena polymorpha]|uniref:Uncharacterized protein n=1 Tax=Dreissena polymorpha TaxID=45954 RepID=A0A9D4JCV0_DREPO|nr:hypothetical protein DPMN_156883 [Dreissena polymorpha]